MTQLKNNYDAAILGWWYGKNYGSILTYYGLNRAIDSLGYSVLMVHEPIGYNGYRVSWPDDILSMQFARRIGYDYTTQMHYTKLPSLNDVARNFIVGSDQLWNPLIGRVNDDLFLDFVASENNRLAYATSFGNRGTDKFKPPFVTKHSQNLQKFKSISVRENYAIDTARDVFGVKATLVVDPVFLLPKEHYSDLASKATLKPQGEYLAVFFLDPNSEKTAVAQAIAEKLGLSKIIVIPNPDDGRKKATSLFEADARVEIMVDDTPENFLSCYQGASYVITDSFHGSAFAAIFEKPFSSIYNTHRGADRFKNLMESLGFGESRRVFETDSSEKIAKNKNITRKIDFENARNYIENGRVISMQWLKKALSANVPDTAALVSNERNKLSNLEFTASNAAWHIAREAESSQLTVAPGGAVRGNLVWCDLPQPLRKGAAYQLKIEWTPRTTAPAINLHVRNPETGKFRVIGTVTIPKKALGARSDTVSFAMPEPGFTQFMLGALHFTGDVAGVEVRSLELVEIPTSAVPSLPAKPKRPALVGSHAEQAKTLALNDQERIVQSHARSQASQGISGARARMMFHAHAIEKGLSRTNFRPGFGKIAVPGLAKEMNAWLAAGRSKQDTFLQSAAAVMKSYFRCHDTLKWDVSEFRQMFTGTAQKLIDDCTHQEGGVLPAAQIRELMGELGGDRNFIEVMYGRRSVREFTREPVQDEDIARAVQIAMQAPSVCNRQGARVHQFEDPRIIKPVLDLQGGFSGYDLPPRLLLITADLDAFLFAAERNQPFIDGGLFMMGLLLGLTQVGLGSCSLNTAMGIERENKIRKIIAIPDNEVFISFVAVGHFDPEIQVPRSKRMEVDKVLIRQNKK